jgi:Tol biopolymer transport system component
VSDFDGVFVTSVEGRGRRQIRGTEEIYDATPRWATDGQSVLVDRGSKISIYSPTAGELRSVNLRSRVKDPDWSPDGRIAYSRSNGASSSIYIINADGAGEKNLTHAPEDADDTAPRWSPDGRTLLFTRCRWKMGVGCRYALYEIPATGGKPRFVRPNAWSSAWSPDGTRIAYADRWGHIHVFDLRTHLDRILDVKPCRNGSWEEGLCDNLDWR